MGSSVITGMRYLDPRAAMEWICEVLGFEKHAVFKDAAGGVAHAELTLAGGMIMLGGMEENEYSRVMKQPDQIGGAETRSLYVVVADADVVYARARAAGSEMVVHIEDKPYGGHAFTCRDPEGHVWDVGTYDPWAPK